MRKHSQFHDGYLDGLWIENKTVHVLVRMLDKMSFTFVATDVVRLNAGPFREGNIILDAVTREQEEISLEDIMELYEITGDTRETQVGRLLAEARREELKILDISSSYGASLLILARSIDMLARGKWARRYSMFLAKQNED